MYKSDAEMVCSEVKEELVRSLLREDLLAVLDDELHGGVFGVHVCHLALQTVVSHDSWCEYHG